MPGSRLALLPNECRDVDIHRLRTVVHEHAPLADERGPAAGWADDDAVARGLDFEFAPRDEVKPIAERLGHDEPAGGINGSFHTTMVVDVVAMGKLGKTRS